MQHFETTVCFVCPQCAQLVQKTVEISEPSWGSVERFSDIYIEDDIDIECPVCHTDFPAKVIGTGFDCTVTLENYPGIRVMASSPGYSAPDDWIPPPARPIDIFSESHRQAEELLKANTFVGNFSLICRMVFTQQISALEAYLADTLSNHVFASKEVLHKLIVADPDLVKEKIFLADVAKSPTALEDAVKAHLNKLLFHNLGKVKNLYKGALGVEVFREKETEAKLIQAIGNRHHCVHRNGFDLDGKRLEMFDDNRYVTEIAALMKDTVEHIEKQLDQTFGEQEELF